MAFERLFLLSAIFLIGCTPKNPTSTIQTFGKTRAGETVELLTLANSHGMQARIMTRGGTVVSLKAPDRGGKLEDVVLGFDSIEGYEANPGPYFGALIGRYGNRIAGGRFLLNGAEYKLAQNNGPNSLHGGLRGFDKVIWVPKSRAADAEPIELTYLSKDGEEGYPGNLSVAVTYTLTESNELKIDYRATTDKDTVLNLTNHSYFNLAGQGEGDVLNHQIMINADRFLPVDSTLIPTGESRSVAGTPFDFRKPGAVGDRINDADEQIKLGGGYDHTFVLNRSGSSLELAARVTEPKSGRAMEVLTTEPGVQFYTGNFLDGSFRGKGGKVYNRRYGLCLETQHFPDSPNKPAFPSVVLKPGRQYVTTTVFRFSTN